MSGCGMTGSGRRWLRLTVVAACLAGAVRGETADPARRTIDGHLYVAYSVARDAIEITKIDLRAAGITAEAAPAAAAGAAAGPDRGQPPSAASRRP